MEPVTAIIFPSKENRFINPGQSRQATSPGRLVERLTKEPNHRTIRPTIIANANLTAFSRPFSCFGPFPGEGPPGAALKPGSPSRLPVRTGGKPFFPSLTVHSTRISRTSCRGISSEFLSNTTRSASLPGVSEPLRSSSWYCRAPMFPAPRFPHPEPAAPPDQHGLDPL